MLNRKNAPLRGSTQGGDIIDSDRFGEHVPNTLTKPQQAFLEKLRNLADINPKKKRSEKDHKLLAAADLCKQLLELLPNDPALAVIVAELRGAQPDVVKQIRDLFNFHLEI